jgi:hypothetical protein
MKCLRFPAALAAIVMGSVMVAAANAEQVESPIYKAWASFKVGSNKTLGGTMSRGGFNMQMEMKEALVEVTSDHVTVEVISSVDAMGNHHDSPPRRQEYPAKIYKPKDWREIGKEDVQAMGRTFHCVVYEGISAAPGRGGQVNESNGKIWTAKEVPGGVVQMRVNSSGGADITFVLKDYQAK